MVPSCTGLPGITGHLASHSALSCGCKSANMQRVVLWLQICKYAKRQKAKVKVRKVQAKSAGHIVAQDVLRGLESHDDIPSRILT